MELAIIAGVVLAVIVVVFALIRYMYRVAEPNEALIVSGFGAKRASADDTQVEASSLGFKIVVGRGVFVLPIVQTVRNLSLHLLKADLTVECVTVQGIPLHVRGVVVYKVGDDFGSIANAARRFLDKEPEMDANVHEVFAGHLRQIIGSMTVESVISGRQELSEQTRLSSSTEMEKLGLIIDSLQIQQVEDPTGYIENLAKPHQASVMAAARIAEAERDREATEKEQAAAALAAKARSESAIEQARLMAASDTEQQKASQAGPLAQAEAMKAVVVQETEVAGLEASREQMRLQSQVVKPAEAERDAEIARAEAERRRVELEAEAQANATRLTATADANATKIKGEAEGAAINARLTAEADGIKKRAEALAQNNEAVINQSIAERLPEIVSAAAESFKGIDNMTVLNGATGVGEILTQVIGQAVSSTNFLREAFANGNGTKSREEEDTQAPAGKDAIGV